MRIFKNRFYRIEVRHKDSWGNWEKNKTSYIITGHKAQGPERVNVVEEYQIKPEKHYRIFDGHVLSHCPIGNGNQAMQFLQREIFQRVQEVE